MHGGPSAGMWTGMLAISVFFSAPGRRASDAEILTHDNRRSAGVLRDGVLTVSLTAGPGTWYPEKKAGPGHHVYAFGEEGGQLSVPGPLVRVPAGTVIRMTIRNTIADAELMVHGLHDRPGSGSPLRIPAGEARAVTFRASAPGTYYYWASTRGVTDLQRRFGVETQLGGALIVDPPGARVDEHIMMIGIEDDSGAVPGERPLRAAALNGLSWPHSLRSTVTVGDTIRMRWINPTGRGHPIHLHGFYFTVESKGNISGDTIYEAGQQRLVVTEFLAPGQTMSVSWIATRPGNWLMHCHNAAHMSSHLRGGGNGSKSSTAHQGKNHTMDVMAGLVTGWQVLPAKSGQPESSDEGLRRREVRLHVQASPPRYNGLPALGFVLQSGSAAPRADSVEVPGPAIVLTEGEPVEIKVLNHLDQPTSIHWHGIELDSYFDGVSGWSGNAQSVAPPVGARDSFAVRFTPPRAGTFIYHSHFDEERQLSSGMYGPLIVLPRNTKYDPRSERHWVLGQVDPDGPGARPTLNGSRTPVLELEPGRPQRIRIININPNIPLTVSVLADSTLVRWRAIAKDGADLPADHARVMAARVRLGVGETADFELTIDQPRDLRVRVTDPAGGVRIDGVVRVRAPDR
jgi:FtsP/CotA-like multicopper oxidase with cupredoxin domain